jgi:uncharacterized membrane protein YfcA
MRTYLIANVLSMIVLFVGVINIIAFREVWILVAASSILIILAIYTIREKNKLKENQKEQPNRHYPN